MKAGVASAIHVVVASAAAAAAVAGSEGAFRLIDGYALTSARLVRGVVANPGAEAVVRADVSEAATAPSIDRMWFDLDPAEPTGAQPDADRELADRYKQHGNDLHAIYAWNTEYLRWVACVEPERFDTEYRPLKDVFVFTPSTPTRFPIYRFLPNARYPDGLVTNTFGWRGRDVPLHKADGVVRIAFVGASTTVNPHTDRFSYPDYVGRWLNQWAAVQYLGVRFEVVNAGREGIDSSSIAAIVREEVAPLDPDLVVYYEGSNQFWPKDYSPWPNGVRPLPPAVSLHVPSRLEDYSALFVRLRSVADRTIRSEEPVKPALTVHWPPDVDEGDPDLHSRRLPLALPVILNDLAAIRETLAAKGGLLAVSTFVWCVYDGMKLNVAENRPLFEYLNGKFWPFTYRHMRRFADFQNRVFAKYARAHDLPLLDVARRVPMDPRLFGDAIHMAPPGVKLMAWSSFQELQPVIAQKLRDGSWPRRSAVHADRHPLFAASTRTMMPISTFRGPCTNESAQQAK
jgi:hypothetical protein